MHDVCDVINHDNSYRVVIVTGDNTKAFSFCAERSNPSDSVPESADYSLTMPVAQLRSPVIAAINGDAVGQGLELALACDLRIATTTAHFALPQITKGLIPWDGATQRLPRLIGKSKALEMLLTGLTIDAQEAQRIGLVSYLCQPGEPLTSAMKLAEQISTRAYVALVYAKEALCKGLDMTLEQGLGLEADLYFLLQTTKDRTEGIKAFLDRRTPRFRGE